MSNPYDFVNSQYASSLLRQEPPSHQREERGQAEPEGLNEEAKVFARLEREVYEKFRTSAKEQGRSLSSEINYQLKKAYSR